MDDAAKVMIAFGFFGTVAITVISIARAVVAQAKGGAKLEKESSPPTEARLARIEQAVDAIAVEVERISEGQRFTTKLLSEQSRPAPKPMQRQLSTNTPT